MHSSSNDPQVSTLSAEPAKRKAKFRLHRPGFRGVAGCATFALAFGALLIPVDFVTEEPGPTFNTIGEEAGQDMISIQGRQTYPVSGALDMTTVSVAGGPNTRISAVQVLATWLASHTVVVPSDLMYAPHITAEDVSTQNAADMSDSQETAEAAALGYLGIEYGEELTVAGAAESGPSSGLFKEGDIFMSLGGTRLKHYGQIAEILDNNGATPIEVVVDRSGQEVKEVVTPVYSEEAGHWILGLYLNRHYDFPFTVHYGLEEVGGPSAGMMFALGIIDELTENNMTGGKHFAGTGTITADGSVGAIGGIAQKMVGARDAGAEVFLAPEANCSEVVGKVPEGLTAIKVSTLDEAAEAVTSIGAGADPKSFPTCEAHS